jgi:hypothetical protein
MNKFLTFAVSALLCASAIPALAQTTPAMPTCAAGDPVVWENSSSKVYHESGDSYFGKTKHGAYACKSAADGAGYHLSGSSSKKASSPASPSAMSGAGTASPAATSSKHHHHHHGSASPAPAMSGVPAPAVTGPAPAPAAT